MICSSELAARVSCLILQDVRLLSSTVALKREEPFSITLLSRFVSMLVRHKRDHEQRLYGHKAVGPQTGAAS
jgi:hypothetical protein